MEQVSSVGTCISLEQVTVWIRYQETVGSGTILYKVPIWNKYWFGPGASLEQVPVRDRHQFLNGTRYWYLPYQVHVWIRSQLVTGTSLDQVPDRNRYQAGSGTSWVHVPVVIRY